MLRIRNCKAFAAAAGLAAFGLAALPSLATASSSRAPTASEYTAIANAFKRDSRAGHAHRRDRVIEVRETLGPSPVARVFFARLGAHKATSRANGTGTCGDCSDYYFRPTGEWKPDLKVTKSIRDQLREAPTTWDVRFKGSGTDDVNASGPGDPQASPYCRQPAMKESDGSSFEFDVGWGILGVDALTKVGVGETTGHGTWMQQEQPGCVNQSDPSPPQTHSCSTDYFTPLIQKGPHASLSGTVDRHGNHELRLHAPVPDKRRSDCASPDTWWLYGHGPVLFLHTVLVPDAAIVQGKDFTITIGDTRSFGCFAPAGYLHAKCSEAVKWTGIIRMKPLPDWRTRSFDG